MIYFHVRKGIQVFAISLIGVLVFCEPGFSQGARANSGRSPGGPSMSRAIRSGGSAYRQGTVAGVRYRQRTPNGQPASVGLNPYGVNAGYGGVAYGFGGYGPVSGYGSTMIPYYGTWPGYYGGYIRPGYGVYNRYGMNSGYGRGGSVSSSRSGVRRR